MVEHIENLLSSPDPLNPRDIGESHTEFPIDVTPPTIEEMRLLIRQIKSGKAVLPDNIQAEVLKSDSKVTANMLHLLFRKIYKEEQVPTDWKEGHVNKIPKKEDLSKLENYRGITPISVSGKLFYRVLMNRMNVSLAAQL